MERAAEAFAVRLRGRECQYAVAVVELPAEWNNAALHPITRLLAHKARVHT